jgi:uncharacterized protein YlxW (UPF0749 family)
MNTSWEKYFWSGYTEFQEPVETRNQSLFFGSLIFLIALGSTIHLKQTHLEHDKLNLMISSKPGITKQIEIVEAENSILESKILIENHKLASILEEKAEQFLKKYNHLMALQETQGEGVILTLNDSTKPLTSGENPNLMIVHNLDLLAIVNELWAGGAKAVSVNDQRITAASEFNCIGPIILINNTRVLPPFTIKAIGDPQKLIDTVTNGYIKRYNLEKYGIEFAIRKNDSIKVPASRETLLINIKGN